MRRPGTRGSQPGKTIPIKPHFTRSFDNTSEDAGISREKVNVDEVMAEKFKPEFYVEKFPHGYDPFAGDETALQKKVVFRPNKHQIDAIKNRRKTQSVNMSPGISGQGPVKHERKFLSKNADYIEMQTKPNLSGPVEHEMPILEKRGDTIELQPGYVYDLQQEPDVQGFKNGRAKKTVQESPALANHREFSFQPSFEHGNGLLGEQHRRHHSIQEEVQTRLRIETELRQSIYQERSHKVSRRAEVPEDLSNPQYDGSIDYNRQAVLRPRRHVNDSDLAAGLDELDYTQPGNHNDPYEHDSKRRSQAAYDYDYQREQFNDEYQIPDYGQQVEKSRRKKNQVETTGKSSVHYDADIYRVEGANSKSSKKQNPKVHQYADVDHGLIAGDVDPVHDPTFEKVAYRQPKKQNPKVNQYSEVDHGSMAEDLEPIHDSAAEKIPLRQPKKQNPKVNQYSEVDRGSMVADLEPIHDPSAEKIPLRQPKKQNPKVNQYSEVDHGSMVEDLEPIHDSAAEKIPLRQPKKQNPKVNQYSEVDHGSVVNDVHDYETEMVNRRKVNAKDDYDMAHVSSGLEVDYEHGRLDGASLTTPSVASAQKRFERERRAVTGDLLSGNTQRKTASTEIKIDVPLPEQSPLAKVQDFRKEANNDKFNQKSRVTEQIVDVNIALDTRSLDFRGMKPVKHQDDLGVLVSVRPPELDVKTRIQHALEKSRRMASAQADSESAGASFPEMTADKNPHLNSQRRQTNPAYAQDARAEPEANGDFGTETSLKFHADKQGNQSAVDISDFSLTAGIEDPNGSSTGYDPISIESINSKRHLAREGHLTSGSSLEIKNEGSEKTGLEVNSRAWAPVINSDLKSGANKPVRFRKVSRQPKPTEGSK